MQLNRFTKICIVACTTAMPVFGSFAQSETVITTQVSSLDAAWQNRHSDATKKEIVKFLLSNPEIPDDFESAWKMARLVFFIGNFDLATTFSKKEHMQIFEVGYKAAEVAKDLKPDRVEGHYWYALNLGKYSLLKGKFTALGNAKIGRDELLEAAKIDPKYHWAGPYRILGKYYQEVPGGISFGDKKIAEEYYKKAIALAPEFRLNTIYLARLEKDKKEKLSLLEKSQKITDVDGKTEEDFYKTAVLNEIEKLK